MVREPLGCDAEGFELVGEEFYLALNTKNPSENEENANEKS